MLIPARERPQIDWECAAWRPTWTWVSRHAGNVLSRFAERGLRVYCANPDVVVERGNRLVYCAGALAQLYQALRRRCRDHRQALQARSTMRRLPPSTGRSTGRWKRKPVLAIGDGLPTRHPRGPTARAIDVLMVTAGIHGASAIVLAPDPARLAARLEEEGLGIRAALPRLIW